MKVCDLCGDIELDFSDNNRNIHFCKKHTEEMIQKHGGRDKI